MEKHTKKRMLALLMVCVIGSERSSNVYAGQESEKITKVAAVVTFLAAVGFLSLCYFCDVKLTNWFFLT